MDNAKFEFVEIPGKHKVIRGEGYEYVIDKTDGVKSYWKCQRKNCKARLLVENNDVDSIKRGKNSHNHEPDMKAQTKITDFLTARADRGERVSGQVTGEQTEAAGRAVQECSDSDTGMDTRENSTEEEGGGGEEEVEEEEEEEEGGGEEEEEEEVVDLEDLERDNNDSDSGDQSDVSTNADVESDCRQTDESDKEGGSDSKLEEERKTIDKQMTSSSDSESDDEDNTDLNMQDPRNTTSCKFSGPCKNQMMEDTTNQDPSRENLAKEAKKKHLKIHDTDKDDTDKDGNCLFHAFCDQLKLKKIDPEVNHHQLRTQLVKHIKEHGDHFKGFLVSESKNDKLQDYCQKMAKDGEWGDNLIIQALADMYKIRVDITSTRSDWNRTIQPNGDTVEERITIGHIPDLHFVSLHLIEPGDDRIRHKPKMSDMHESTTVEDPTMNPTEQVKSKPDEVQVDEADKQDDTGWEDQVFPEMNLSKLRIDNEKPEKPEEAIADLIDSFTSKVKTRAGETPVQGKKLSDGAREVNVRARRSLVWSKNKDDSQNLDEVQGNEKTGKKTPSISELDLKGTTKKEIEEHPSKYQVKLFVITSTNDTAMSSAVNTIVDRDQRFDTSNTTKSFMFFFYKDEDPDIFVMTSGQAYRKVQSKSCEQFPKKVARRLLEFKVIKIETRNVTGKQEQTRKIFAPNHPEIPNILDLIHVIVHSYTASPRLGSSLYDLKDFEKIKECRFTINPFFLKAHATLSFTGMLSFIKHVADIDNGKSTYPCKHRLVQCDKVENKKYSPIEDEQLKSDLEQWLLMHLNELCINNINVKSDLTGECSLYVKGKHKPFKTFESPSTLMDMLKELTDGCVTVDKLAKIQLRRENDKKRIFITEYLDVPVTMNNKQYRFRKGKWWTNKSEITNEKEVLKLKKEFTEQTVEPMFHGSQIENNLTITNRGSEAYELFEDQKKKPYKRWDTLPTFRDICIALVEQERGIKFSFSWFIEKVKLKIGNRREHIGKYIDEIMIKFDYDGKSYIYSFITKSFIKVDQSEKLEEEDDNQFNCFELIQEEKDEQMIEELMDKFDESLKNHPDLCIPLSLPDLSQWLDVGTFKLFLPRKQKHEKQWTGMPATLKELLDATGTCQTSLDWLQNTAKFTMQCKGGSTQERRPITELLVHQITLRDKPYFFWHGKWLKIKFEFISIVAEKFRNYLKDNTLTRQNFLPLPWVNTGKPEKGKDEESLPWKNTGKDTSKTSDTIKSRSFLMEDLIKFMKSRFLDMDDNTCRNVLKQISAKGTEPDTAKGIKYTKHQYKKNDQQLVMLMFLRVHSNLVEHLYNTCYILYDKYLNKPGEGYIVGDQILTTNNIEMFDILKFDEETTYLIHVKDGFGQTVRDVCSQIKNSAKLLFNSMTSVTTRSMLEEMWRTYTSDPTEGVQKLYRCATQEKMKELGRDCFLSLFNTNKRRVVYVLALRKQKWKEEMSMVEALAQHYGDEITKDIVAVLEKQGFVTDELLGQYILTDKFRLQLKEEFIKTMEKTCQKDLKIIWGNVLDILKTNLPDTDSTIAKLEIVELFDNFDNQFGKVLTLKLFFLPTSLEDLETAIVPMTEE